MQYFDLASPVDTNPSSHEISNAAQYAEWVRQTKREGLASGLGDVAVDGAKPENSQKGRWGSTVVNQAFREARVLATDDMVAAKGPDWRPEEAMTDTGFKVQLGLQQQLGEMQRARLRQLGTHPGISASIENTLAS